MYQAIGSSGGVHYMAVMKQPVQKGRGENFITSQHLWPFYNLPPGSPQSAFP